MFFGDPNLLETSLHNDFNTMIRNIVIREEQYGDLIEYNKQIINKKRDQDGMILVH